MAESVESDSDHSEECTDNLHETEEFENFSILTILNKGNTFNYVVPSFPIFNADIVKVKLQWEERCENGNSKDHVFDGFTRYSEDLDHPLPGIVHVEYSYDCAFMIEVSTVYFI